MENEYFECAKCGKITSEFYEYTDWYYERHICEDCWNDTFAEELKDCNTEWFTMNYDLDELRGYNESFKKRIGV